MKLSILLIAHFCDEVGLGGNNRFNYLASVLAEQGHDVELITSSFSHTSKSAKLVDVNDVNDVNSFKLTYIYEPSYSKNVSLRRFWAHGVMAKQLRKHLNQLERPDVVYCAVPSLSVAEAASEFAAGANCPFVVDVQDLWPEAFFMVSGLLSKVSWLAYPLKAQADRVYQAAQGVVAVSERYKDRALEALPGSTPTKVLYLGTDLARFDSFAQQATVEPEGKGSVEFVYLGTLGHSYDLSIAIRAFKLAQQATNQRLKLTVMGDGPLKPDFEALARELNVEVDFVGRLPYELMVPRLVQCDVALNVITKGAAQSVINKHADYAAAGLPILNTQECLEYRGLVDRFHAGIHCDNESPEELASAMVRLAENPSLRKELAKGSRKMGESLFDRDQSYRSVELFLREVSSHYKEGA